MIEILGLALLFGIIAVVAWVIFEVLIDDGDNQLMAYAFTITILYLVIGVLWGSGIKFPLS